MNREQKRAFVENAQKKEIPKKQAENLLKIADATGNTYTPLQAVNTGDRVTLKVDALKSKKNYDIMNPAYKDFVEKSEGVVYTAVRGGTELIHLEEAPKWLFWCGDLDVIEAAAEDLPVTEKESELIYLDNAATTPISPGVRRAVIEAMNDDYGNPGALYSIGRNAKEKVDAARKNVADSMKAEPGNIIFTSGGSEANSLVFSGTAEYLKSQGKDTIVVSAIEHDSVLRAAESVCIKHGFHLIKMGVSNAGTVSIEELETVLNENGNCVGLVSIMYVNNEIGSVNPIDEIGALCKRYGSLFHTDCVQAFGFEDIDVEKFGCDFLSVSSHKIHGPKGVGALYVSDTVKNYGILNPIIFGGSGQEFGLRGGTENVPGIVGFGEACREISDCDRKHIIDMATTFVQDFIEEMSAKGLCHLVSFNGYNPGVGTKTLSITLHGIDNDTALIALDRKGICIGTGSACRSLEVTPSHVLKAIGLSDEDAMSTIRVSFSKNSTL